MTRSPRLVTPPVDEFRTVEIPVIDGELDQTAEIPLIRLRPAVPLPASESRRSPRRQVDLRRYGWLIGLLLAGLFFYVQLLPVQLPGWLLVAAVIWMVVAAPVAFVIGRGIRIADDRDGIR